MVSDVGIFCGLAALVLLFFSEDGSEHTQAMVSGAALALAAMGVVCAVMGFVEEKRRA